MKRIMNHSYPLLCAGLLILWGCNFSEECHYTGNVNVSTDWVHLVPGDSIPTTEAGFYLMGGGVQRYEISGDTLLREVLAGEQTVLLVSRTGDLTFTGMESIVTVRARLPTYTEKGVTYTIQAPLLYADRQRIQVLPFDTTACRFVPTPCIRQVNFTFHIIREVNTGEALTMDGALNGVKFCYDLGNHQATGSMATLKFPTVKVTADEFKQTVRAFGFSQVEKSLQLPANLLTLWVQLSDGHRHKAVVSMDELLANVTAPVLNCKIDVHISSLGMWLEIAGWETGNWGEIELS